MGDLVSKNKTKKGNKTSEKNDEDPAPTKNEETEQKEINDLPKKRKLVEFLLSNDLNIFKKHLKEVSNLSDEKFKELFDGNTEYNYNVSNEKEFRQLAQKFEDNKDLLYECYEKEDYYNYVLKFWRPNILQKLKDAETDIEKNKILEKYKIDISLWDEEFKESFNIIINTTPIKSLAERMQNYIEADYGDFDELIKNVEKCKKTVGKEDNSHCNKTLTSNLDTSMSRILNVFVPNFLKKLSSGIDNIPSNIKKAEEDEAIKQILKSKLSKTYQKRLIDNVKKIYKERNKDSSFLGYNKEYEKLKELSIKFNKEDTFFAFGHGKINFKKMSFEDKANIAFSNKMIKHAILGLSMANLTYSVMHLTKTFMDYNKFKEEFKFRLNEIRQKFIRHQSEVKLITNETDIDKAIELIIENGKKFNQDLTEVEELISDINEAMNGVKNEKNKSILNIIGSSGGLLIGLFGASVTKGEDRLEYTTASFADVLALASNSADIVTQNKAIRDYQKYISDALKLKEDILNEIEELRKKFYSLSGQHYT